MLMSLPNLFLHTQSILDLSKNYGYTKKDSFIVKDHPFQ